MNNDSLIFRVKSLLYPLPRILISLIDTLLCFFFFECWRTCDALSVLLCSPVRFPVLHLVCPVYADLHFFLGHFMWYVTLCKCSSFVLSFTGNLLASFVDLYIIPISNLFSVMVSRSFLSFWWDFLLSCQHTEL